MWPSHVYVADGGPINEYSIGRTRTCDLRLDDARISGIHCRIYCEQTKGPGRLKPYIEDMSSNGTYINHDVKLCKVSLIISLYLVVICSSLMALKLVITS